MHKALSPLFQLSLCTFSCLYAGSTQAQVTSDGTVNTQVNQNGNVAEITGGETRGDNLFHSFQDFSVATGNEAFFNNANDIANIFSRVTGGNRSDINGAIRVNGSANLFLINPAGIIFGENASLDIGGSFYGSSADSILFEDGEFSATDLDNPPLLTINAPIGLGFRDEPTSITNRSDTLNPTGEIPPGLGLEVEQGQNISLFGGEINFDAGFVYAPGGRVELGGLSEAGTINFDANLQAIFPENVARADVNLTGGSIAFVRSNGGGEINVNARNINLIDGSQLFEGIAENMGSPEAQAGNITLNATDDITFDGINTDRNFPSGIPNVVQAGATGNGGDISISARNLSLTNGAQIFTSLLGQGNAGNINIDATNVLIDGQGNTDAITGVYGLVSSNGIGNGGNISITTDSFTLRNIASLDTSNSGQGNGGNININASDSISVEGQGGTSFNTNIFTSAFNSSGNAGNIDLTADSLSLNNGASLVASGNDQSSAGEITIRANDIVSLANQSNINVTTGADGGFLNINAKSLEITSQSNLFAGINIDSGSAETQAGDIVINVAENVLIDSLGESSQATTSISNTNFSTGNAGNIIINAKNIDFNNGGNIFNSNSGQGNLGSIDLTATETITFDGLQGAFRSGVNNFITDTGTGDIGNINITAQNLTLNNGAAIQSLVAGMADSGNISINVADQIMIDGTNSNAVLGDGMPTTFNSEITSTVADDGKGNSGDINITTGSLFLSSAGEVSSEILGQGNAGNITIDATDTISLKDSVEGVLPEVGIGEFRSNIAARVLGDAVGNGGSIEINTANFSITNLAQLNTSSFSQGDAGNINVNATDTFFANDSLISSNVGNFLQVPAVGKVGNISITAKNISFSGTAQIQAGAFSDATAEATGTVSLTASESISFTGNNTGIFSNNDPGSFGNASNTQIFAPSITLDDGAIIEASNAANGEGGNVAIESDELILNGSSIRADAEGNEGSGASISLNVAEDISLQNNSIISARAFNNADGGNLKIDTNYIVAFPSNGNGNDIIASAEQGVGGNITIDAESVLGIERRSLSNSTNDINASSNVFGFDGTVNINTSDINPLQGATELPSNIIEAQQTSDQTCSVNGEGRVNNGLEINGKGGITPAPDLPLNSQNIIVDGKISSGSNIPAPIETSQGKIQPARGLIVTEDGRVILTAFRTNNAGERIPEPKPNCN